MAGHHHDRHGGEARLRRRALAHRVAVHAGHVDVEKHDGDVLRQGGLQRGRAVVKGERRQAPGAGGFREQQAAEILIVGDDRDPRRGACLAHALARRRCADSSSIRAGYAAASRSYSSRARGASPATHSRSSSRTSRAKALAPTLAALEPNLWQMAAAATRSAASSVAASCASGGAAPARNSSTSRAYKSTRPLLP